MTCECFSYNHRWGTTPERILPAPEWSTKDSICVDECIADTIQYLWDHGHITLSTCCGHGRMDNHIVLGEDEDPNKVRGTLEQSGDPREFNLYQWKRIKV